MKLNNTEEAATYIELQLLNDGIKTRLEPSYTKDGALHLNLIDDANGIFYHIKFNREAFLTFGNYFPGYGTSLGDTLNDEVVQKLPDNTILFFCYPERIYKVTFKEFIKPKLIRDTKQGAKTWAYPLDYMEIWRE